MKRAHKRSEGFPSQLDYVPEALASAYEQAGQLAKAEPIYRDSLEQARRQYGSEDLHTAAWMAGVGFNLFRQQKYTDAEPLLRACLNLREAKQPEDWTTFNARSLLGRVLLGQQRYAEAEPLLLEGYEGMKAREAQIPLPGQVRVHEALERLVRLYESMNSKYQADSWRK